MAACGAGFSAIDTFSGAVDFLGEGASFEVATLGPSVLFGIRSLWMTTKAMIIRTEQATKVSAHRRERLAGENMRRSEFMA